LAVTVPKISRGRQLWITAAAGIAIAGGTLLASGISSASPAGLPTGREIPVAGVPARTLTEYGIRVSSAPAPAPESVATSRAAAVKTAESQPISASRGVRQAVLARVTFTSKRPVITGLYWVISLRPTGYLPMNGPPGFHPRKLRTAYYVVFIAATNGRFFEAILG
jgi:hypothetical protein